MKEINGFTFEESAADVLSNKIWYDIYDIALEHANEHPLVASNWFKENFGSPDGFVDWMMEYRPLVFELWATGFYDE